MLTLDDQQWKTLMCDINYCSIINNLHTNCKLIKISDNIYYSINLNQFTIILYVNDNFITLLIRLVFICSKKIINIP